MRGSCLCGAATWEARGPARPPVACHSTQGRKPSGLDWAATQVPREALRVEGEVRWVRASAAARRGFCPTCGASLSREPLEEGRPAGRVPIGTGTIDGPSGLPPQRHILAGSKGDAFAIPAEEAQVPGDG